MTLAAGLVLAGSAHAGTLAGARDGSYGAQDGDFLSVASADDRVGLDGLDCKHPVVRGDRIAFRECWGNGHRGADVEGPWRVEGDVIWFRGKRFTRLPSKSPASAGRATADAGAQTAERVDPTGRPWSHNGSVVMLDPGTGIIAYHLPKPALASVVEDGSVLFRGRLSPGGSVVGTAFAFKAGCPAAPYQVRGAYSRDGDTLILRGAGPVRRGCEVVGHSDRSPHAVLKFTYLLDD